MGQRITQVDAFTDVPFAGNPAAVCILTGPADPAWMQAVALEMNLSETAFLHPEGEPGRYRLRWFTPTVEVDLCGHATLASAHVLWEEGHAPSDAGLRFETRSGTLTASRVGPEIELDFPTSLTEPHDWGPDLEAALGARPLAAGRTPFDAIAELESEAAVRALRPDLGRLATIPARGVIVTARSERPGVDFVSRFFAPQSGVAEDPVTGSAHCALGPYWESRLGKSDLLGEQVSTRGGFVRVVLGDGRARLRGRAVTVLRGELVAPASDDPRANGVVADGL